MTRRALDAVVELLDLEPIEVNMFRGQSPDEDRQRTFGGQVAGQALVAASRTVDGHALHSVHADKLGDWVFRPRAIDTRYVDWEPADRRETLPPHQRVWMRADGTRPTTPSCTSAS